MDTQEKITSLRKDFLDRDQDNYVRIRRSGRLGWESLIPAGGNYSDMLRNCRGEGDIIKEAYGMARDYIVAMDTPYRVTLRLSPEANCTDSKVVYLATRVFDDADLSDGQKIDTFVGLAVHEGCHLKYTDFSQMTTEPNGIVRNLINVLEDERIERLCGEQMPGYANFLKATKYYMFDLYRQRKMEEAQQKELPKHVRLLNAILAIIRYPKALGDADLEGFAEVLYDVREVVLDYPATPAAVTSAAKDIYELTAYFSSEDKCKKALFQSRWDKNDVVCPHCGQNFSVTAGTIFENTKIPFRKWFLAMYLISCHKKGISSVQLATDIAVIQKKEMKETDRFSYMFKKAIGTCYYRNVKMAA